MKYCKPELSFFIFTSYERSECFIFGVKRKMLHSRMKWSCFIVRRFLWSILRRCRKIWSASCDAWSGTACHEAKPDGFVRHFFCRSKMLLWDLPSFHSGYPAFLQKKMAEGVGFEPTEGCPSAVFKTAALNHSTILPRNMRYIIVCPIKLPRFFDFSSPDMKKVWIFYDFYDIFGQ